MEGLVVNVEKDEVASIVRDNEIRHLRGRSGAQPNDSANDLDGFGEGITSNNTIRWEPDEFAPRSDNVAPAYPNLNAENQIKQNRFDLGTGFNGIDWQMRPEQLPGLEKVETDPAFGGIDQYWIPKQPLKWGWADLNGWVFGFWQDHLYSIMMWANGPASYQNLRNQAFKAFGPGTRNVDNEERYVWDEPSTQRMIEYDSQLGVGIFIMRSSKLDAQIKKRYPD